MKPHNIEFNREDYLDCSSEFEEGTLNDVEVELSEFSSNAEDLAYELAYTRYWLAKLEMQLDNIKKVVNNE